MCHDNEEWCKLWKGIDSAAQNWHEEFDDLWPQHSRILEISTVMSWFGPKYIMFELEKYKGVMLNCTGHWCKIWNKTDLRFQKWLEEFDKSSTKHWILIQKLKENWLALSKMTCGIWQIFNRALESLKIGTLIEYFYLK